MEGDKVDVPGVGGEVQGVAGAKVIKPVNHLGVLVAFGNAPPYPTALPATAASPTLRFTPPAENTLGVQLPAVVPLYCIAADDCNANRYCAPLGIKNDNPAKQFTMPDAVTVIVLLCMDVHVGVATVGAPDKEELEYQSVTVAPLLDVVK